MRDSHYRVLQYVHDSFMVGCLSDRSINASKGIVAYGIKGLDGLMLWWFYLNESLVVVNAC